MVDYKLCSSVIKGRNLRQYFLEHVTPYTGRKCHREKWKSYFWKVTTELKVFKLARDNRVIALVIPVGAIIYAHPSVFSSRSNRDLRKMRANKAFVHSIYNIGKHNFGSQADSAISRHDCDFVYVEKKIVKPAISCDGDGVRFSFEPEQCAEGIHFFLNFNDAFLYN